MVVRQRRYPKEEFARRGRELYERGIRHQVEGGNKGKFVAIDIETGAWEMDSDRKAAGDRLRQRLPEAQTWMMRIGYSYTTRFGAGGGSETRVITGTVNADREPVVRIRVRDYIGREHDYSAIVDTGYTGSLTLPSQVIIALRLPWKELSTATLADGSDCPL